VRAYRRAVIRVVRVVSLRRNGRLVVVLAVFPVFQRDLRHALILRVPRPQRVYRTHGYADDQEKHERESPGLTHGRPAMRERLLEFATRPRVWEEGTTTTCAQF
jgi:hypothetical protein